MSILENRSERCRRVVTGDDLRDAIMPSASEIQIGLVPLHDRLFRSNMRELFKTEGASGGGEWADLTDNPPGQGYKSWKDRFFGSATAYVRRQAKARGRKITKAQVRKALGAENKKLQLTGDLMRSLTTENDEHIAWYDRSAGIVQLGTTNDVAGYHWAGTPIMAQRNPIQHTAAQGMEYGEITDKWMLPRFRRAISALRKAGRATRRIRQFRAARA